VILVDDGNQFTELVGCQRRPTGVFLRPHVGTVHHLIDGGQRSIPRVNTPEGGTRMDSWNRLLTLLDQTLGFSNKIRSTVKKRWQSFDQRTGEHVFVLEYRIKVKPGVEPPAKMPSSPRDLHKKTPIKPVKPVGPMGTLRELMDVRFVHTEDSSPSSPSPKSGKRTTTKPTLRPRKLRPNLPRPCVQVLLSGPQHTVDFEDWYGIAIVKRVRP
jgi:hypothetical protein